jgi:zinc transport system substrate-binding protein
MNKKYIIGLSILVVLIVGSFVLFSNKKENVVSKSKIKVVTTLFPLFDFVKEIGGDKVEVSLLLPPGVEAHSFEPKPSDIIKINESDVFAYTGKFMEPWAEDIIKGVTNKEVSFVNTSDGINLMKLTEGMPDEAHGIDPHIWLDFDNNKIMVDIITKALVEKDPSNSSFYQKNATEYKNKLANLDDQYKSGLTKCENKEIVYGGHYAFGYLANRYNLKYLAAQGLAPDSEPTANDLIKLVEQVKKNNIKYVFYEEMTTPKIAETIANETNAKMLLLNAAHNVTKEDIENNVSFLSIMNENLINLKTGLVCSK